MAWFSAQRLQWLGVVLLGAVAGLSAAFEPYLTMAAVAGATTIALALFRPKAYVALAAFSLLLVRTLISATSIPGIAYLDEIVVIIAVAVLPTRRLLMRSQLRRFPGDIWFAAFAFIGFLSSMMSTVPAGTMALGALLMLKGPLIGWAIAQIDWEKKDLVRICRITGYVLIFIFLCTAVNIVIPGAWTNLLLGSSTRYAEERFGLPILIGPFAHPGYFAGLMALSGLALISYRTHIAKSKLTLIMLAGSFITILLTFRRKTIAAVLASLITLPVLTRKLHMVGVIFVGTVATLFVAGEFLLDVLESTYTEYLVDPDRVARIRLTLDAPIIATQHFPWGAGFGRFGSGIARQNYSPEYETLGYPRIWGLGPTDESGKFLTDTFWPAVLGETGFFGLIAYSAALFSIFRLSRTRIGTPEDSWSAFLKMICALWTIELLVESLAEPVFMSAPIFGIYFGFIGIIVGYFSSSSGELNDEISKYTFGRP